MAFAPLSSVDASTLRWLRTGDPPLEFSLLSGATLVARLRWQKEAGSLATAESASETWSVKRGGFLNPHVTVRKEHGTQDLARLSVHLNHHEIEIPGGPTYRFRRAGLLLPAWKVTGRDGEEILHVEPVREGRALVAGAAVAPSAAASRAEFLLVVVLTWYFIALAWFEDEALVPLEGADATV